MRTRSFAQWRIGVSSTAPGPRPPVPRVSGGSRFCAAGPRCPGLSAVPACGPSLPSDAGADQGTRTRDPQSLLNANQESADRWGALVQRLRRRVSLRERRDRPTSQDLTADKLPSLTMRWNSIQRIRRDVLRQRRAHRDRARRSGVQPGDGHTGGRDRGRLSSMTPS